MEFLFHGISYHVGKLSCVLSNGWDTDCSRPVEVAVALVIGELEEDFLGETCCVVTNDELSWGSTSLGHLLGDEIEIEMLTRDILVDESSWVGILEILVSSKEESVIDFLLEDDVGKFRLVLGTDFLESLLNSIDFDFGNLLTGGISRALSVENNMGWELLVGFLECLDGFLNDSLDGVQDIVSLSSIKNDDCLGPELIEFSI